MRKLIFFLFFSLLFLFPTAIFAHELEIENSIGAVLHIDPLDNPKVGKPAKIYFEIKDKDNEFRPEICDCQLIISKDGVIFVTAKIYGPGSQNNSVFEYAFPKEGVYQLELSGKPIEGSHFDNFEFNFETKVSLEGKPTILYEHWIHVILFGGAFGVAFGMYFVELYKIKKSKSKIV